MREKVTSADERGAGVATGLILQRHEATGPAEVLMLRKTGGSWPGHWVFPGGRLQHGEGFAAGVLREAQEETGFSCRSAISSVRLVAVTNVVSPDLHLVGFLMEFRGHAEFTAIENREPHKHDQIGWFPWSNLPQPLHPGVQAYLCARLGGTELYGPMILGRGRWASCMLLPARVV